MSIIYPRSIIFSQIRLYMFSKLFGYSVHYSTSSSSSKKIPNTPQNLPCVQDSQELVFCGGFVEVGRFFIDKECIRDPDQIYVFSTHHELLKPFTFFE